MDAISRELQKYYVEGFQTVFNAVSEAQHLASWVSQTMKGTPTIHWISGAEEFQYKGDKITRLGWVAMLHGLRDQLEERLSAMMFGLRDELLVNLKNAELCENPAERGQGYSFISDRRNAGVLEPHRIDRLLSAVLANDKLFKRFVRLDASGKPRIRVHAARAWLAQHAEFWSLFLSCLILSCGGAIRSTELTGTNFINGRDGVLRNVMMYGTVCINREYAKNTGRTGLFSSVPIALDARLANLLIQALVVVRPFCLHLAAAAYPNSPIVLDMYRTKTFVNEDRLFKTDDLTTGLGEATLRWLNVRLGLLDIRHIARGWWRRMGVLSAEELVLFDHDGQADADGHMDIGAYMAMHSESVDLSTYARTDGSHGSSTEEMIQLCQAACVRMHHVFELVPGTFP